MRVNSLQIIRDDCTCNFVFTLENGHVYETSEKADLLACHTHCHTGKSADKEFQFCELVSVTLWLILGGIKKQDFYRNAICNYEEIFKGNRDIKTETVWLISTLMSLSVQANRAMTQEELNDKFSREQTYLLTNFREIQEKS